MCQALRRKQGLCPQQLTVSWGREKQGRPWLTGMLVKGCRSQQRLQNHWWRPGSVRAGR